MTIHTQLAACAAILAGTLGAALAQGASPSQPVAHAVATPDPMRAGFEQPPAAARPRVWWHWMNGNITKEGIKADLQWMHDTGIGGFQNFDAALQTPQVVDKRLVFMRKLSSGDCGPRR